MTLFDRVTIPNAELCMVSMDGTAEAGSAYLCLPGAHESTDERRFAAPLPGSARWSATLAACWLKP
jgi:hypothetical protein